MTGEVGESQLVGMSAGRIVFDDAPDALTADASRALYGLEAGEVMDTRVEVEMSAAA